MQLLLWVCLALLLHNYSWSSSMEDKLETEIDVREPRSFTEGRHEILSVRVDGFRTMYVGHPDHVDVVSISNWEVFAVRYWYETRTVNASCPMTPNGISAEADWSLMLPCLFGDPYTLPRIIFVHNTMLPHFVESTCNFLNDTARFVLVSGGTDMTVPRQVDQRYRGAFRGFGGSDGGRFFNILVNSPKVIHWFAENHDMPHPKVSSLPTGLSIGGDLNENLKLLPDQATISPVTQRPMKVFSSDRVRSGQGQWAQRAYVKSLCLKLPQICMTPPDANAEGIARADYLELLVSVPFVACVQGGGIDPSPKAWEAVMVGTIPIIQSSYVDDAYLQLPVVIIQHWESVFNDSKSTQELQAMLSGWAEALAPYYAHNSALRAAALERLKTKYWLSLMQEKIDAHDKANNYTNPPRNTNHRQLRKRSRSRRQLHSTNNQHKLPRNLAIWVPHTPDSGSNTKVTTIHNNDHISSNNNGKPGHLYTVPAARAAATAAAGPNHWVTAAAPAEEERKLKRFMTTTTSTTSITTNDGYHEHEHEHEHDSEEFRKAWEEGMYADIIAAAKDREERDL